MGKRADVIAISAPRFPTRTRIALGIYTALMMLIVATLVFAHHDGEWVLFKSLVFGEGLVLVTVLIAVVVLKLVERKGHTKFYSSMLYGLEKKDRKIVAKAVNKGRVVTDERLAGRAVEYAKEQRGRTKSMIILWSVLGVLQLGFLIGSNHRPFQIFYVVVLFANAIIWVHLRRRAAQASILNEPLCS